MVLLVRPLMIILEKESGFDEICNFLSYYTFYNSKRRLYHHP
jgi:hypothetical protein